MGKRVSLNGPKSYLQEWVEAEESMEKFFPAICAAFEMITARVESLEAVYLDGLARHQETLIKRARRKKASRKKKASRRPKHARTRAASQSNTPRPKRKRPGR